MIAKLSAIALSAAIVTASCSNTPTPWEQGAATISAERLESAEGTHRLAHEVGPRLSEKETFCLSNPADLRLFRDLFGDASVTTVHATDGVWELTLSPPLNREPSGAWGQHLEITCTIGNASAWNQPQPPQPPR